ncbi:MAG: hypothetical protein BWX64_02849 [Acidobacteria bacterium ADurb.Bin051]|nr:MAG: hypothetical protein BWX64_02849 [Acidobacteria bacterium ADurb.Bin051]
MIGVDETMLLLWQEAWSTPGGLPPDALLVDDGSGTDYYGVDDTTDDSYVVVTDPLPGGEDPPDALLVDDGSGTDYYGVDDTTDDSYVVED